MKKKVAAKSKARPVAGKKKAKVAPPSRNALRDFAPDRPFSHNPRTAERDTDGSRPVRPRRG